MKAIKETGNTLVAALDPFDSVGVMDSYFPDAAFFTEPERFGRHLDKLRRQGNPVQYVSICIPNYLHDAHIRMALRNGADAICEKPIVLNPWNIEALQEIGKETGRRVYTILQLRHHPAIVELKERITKEIALEPGKMCDINLTYINSRGAWYHRSWKGDVLKSGGVATNIGVHFFDMLTWIFGPTVQTETHTNHTNNAAGSLILGNAHVQWQLSINCDHLPDTAHALGKTTYRSITVDGQEIKFSGGFTDLHTASYQSIINGKGYGLKDALPSVRIVKEIRDTLVERVITCS